MGIVLRAEHSSSAHAYQIAATLERYEFVRERELQMPAAG
jgi:hypothetical protein